jgi:hypothetical protein
MVSTRQLDRKLIEEARTLLNAADLNSENGRRMQALLLVASASQAARHTKYVFWSLVVLAAGTFANVIISLCR